MNTPRFKAGLAVGSLLFAGLYLLLIPGACRAAGGDDMEGDKVLAEVNGQKLSSGDYRSFLMKLGQAPDSRRVDPGLLNKLIEETLIIQAAGRRGVHVTDAEVEQSIKDFISKHELTAAEFEKTIAGKGMTLDEYKRWLRENIIVVAKMVYAEVDSHVSVDDRDVADYYNQNRDLFVSAPEQLTVAAIIMAMSENPSAEEITDMKMKALRIVSDVRKGASFEKMVSLHSDDQSREQGGMLGVFRKGELDPAFEKALSGLKPGEISEPVWTRNGVSILKLVKKSAALQLPLKEVSPAIRNTLMGERKDKEYKRWVRSLWERSSVIIH